MTNKRLFFNPDTLDSLIDLLIDLNKNNNDTELDISQYLSEAFEEKELLNHYTNITWCITNLTFRIEDIHDESTIFYLFEDLEGKYWVAREDDEEMSGEIYQTDQIDLIPSHSAYLKRIATNLDPSDLNEEEAATS